MMRHAVIENGTVVNVIIWDGQEDISLPDSVEVVASDSANIGDAYLDGAFVSPAAPALPPEAVATTVRAQRDALLLATDWTQLPDVPKETKAKFVPYRAALRDVPQQVGFPADVKWPATPQ